MMTLVIGVDYGTDAVRAVIVDATGGNILGQAAAAYPRWAQGRYCDPETNRFRQHPLDHMECMEDAVKQALARSWWLKLCMSNQPETEALSSR